MKFKQIQGKRPFLIIENQMNFDGKSFNFPSDHSDYSPTTCISSISH